MAQRIVKDSMHLNYEEITLKELRYIVHSTSGTRANSNFVIDNCYIG